MTLKWMLVRPWGPNCLILEAKTFKILPKRLPKYLKYRSCGAETFLERLGVALGQPRGMHPELLGASLGARGHGKTARRTGAIE